MKEKVAIIGSGLGGMASAIRLKSRGYDVTVFEKNHQVGGKMGQIHAQGYRYDTGPSVFTMPGLVDQLFTEAGEDPGEYYRYEKLEQSCRYFYEDGTTIDAFSDPTAFIRELTQKTGEPERHIHRFLEKSRTIYNLTADLFMFHSIHDPEALLTFRNLKALMQFGKIDAFQTMHQSNAKRFRSDKLVQLFDRYATYNGSDPYRTPATFNIISHLEHNMGVYYPEGGIYAIADAMGRLMEKMHIRVHLNQPVRQLIPEGRSIRGVVTDLGEDHFDHVISNMDVNLFYESLLPDERKLKKIRKPEKSSSALIFYWNIQKEFPSLNLHNILFSEDYPREFEYLFTEKQIYSDPTVYIYISSKSVAGDAPRGGENWYVMVNAPENTGQNWSQMRREARKNIITKINRVLGTQIQQHIGHEQVYDPPTIESHTASYHGSLYGNSSNGRFAAFNRHSNFSRKYKNLYFTGGSVHPGGGIPLVLSGARIVSEKILKYEH